MNESFSRSQFPNGGWKFFQPQTGWWAPSPMMHTFDQTVQQIIMHRRNNPAVVASHGLSLDPVAVGNELENFTRQRLGIPMEANSPKMPPVRTLPQSVRESVVAVGRMAEGIGLLMDWLPQGKTVSPDLAERRAGICARGVNGGRCPKNDKSPLTDWFAKPVAEKLQKMVEARKDVKLETPYDAELGTCTVCLCPMKLKAHVPLDNIIAKTKPGTLAEFPAHCWIAKRDQ